MADLIDVLNREGILKNILEIIEHFSNNKESITFAIDGEWGCGKSFLLQMIENEIESVQDESSASEKYLIFHYNCWKYDYYDEPLIAIVSLMLEEIDKNVNFLSSKQKARIIGILKAVGLNFISALNKVIENKTGIDMEQIRKVIAAGDEAAAKQIESDNCYDDNFSFKKTLYKLQEIINELSKERTIILIVDELDRCMPGYSIKVLERLHHLTEDTNNVITILATDKFKLEKNIESLGFQDANQYLKKFISFEISLDNGILSSLFNDRISNYLSLFDFRYTDGEGVYEYIEPIFSNIDMRNRIQLVDKAYLIHKMLFQNKKDETFMLMELLLVVLVDFYGENYCEDTRDIPFYKVFNNVIFKKESEKALKLIDFVNRKRKEDTLMAINLASNPKKYLAIMDDYGIFEILMCYWFRLHKNEFYYSNMESEDILRIRENIADLERFVDLMKIIK